MLFVLQEHYQSTADKLNSSTSFLDFTSTVINQTFQTTSPDMKTTTKVVLATYLRGGSTFLGEMLNYNPDAFYMFEPLLIPYDNWSSKLSKIGASSTMYFYSNGTE